MNKISIIFISISLMAFALAACEEAPAPTKALPPPPPAIVATQVPTAQAARPTAASTTAALPAPTVAAARTAAPPTPSVVRSALTCPPIVPLAANAPVAARVNGQGISLDLYNRQVAQAQAAMVSQGLDANSAQGQEALKSLKQQVLDQMINDVAIAIKAEEQGSKITENDLNARLAQMVQDAGSVDKLNEYLTKNQLTLGDLCLQIRNQILGETMLNTVSAPIPSAAEQIHVRHILVSTTALAQTVRNELRSGKDFAALAKQYSVDEASKVNGGDLGWVPKGVLDPQFEAIAFQLRVGETSDVVTTQFGYHLIRVDEKESNRALPPEVLQTRRQQAFLTWLNAVRQTMKIERFVQ